MVWIVMGVSGSGKTTVGKLLANTLNLPFYDADDFHPTSNVEKMSSGQPLNDDDRQPWLIKLAEQIKLWNSNGGAVLACSALKQSYRELLCSESENVRFIYLKGSKELIRKRMGDRKNHYMPASLLNSQFSALEEPESAITIDINNTPEKIKNNILEQISR